MRSFLGALALLAMAATASGDVFRILDDDRQAAQARVDLFQQAGKQIDALYFLARNDRMTLAALALLRDARRRGVPNVRLIVDANFQHIPKGVLGYLRDEGVEIKVYHPMTLRHPLWVFYRMHEKVIVVDGSRYITGGRNLAESYFGLSKHRNYVDRDVYVEGASAAEADRHFENLWRSRHVADLRVQVSAEEKARAARLLENAVCELQASGFVRLDTDHDWSAGMQQVESVEFLHDPIVAGAGARVGEQLAQLLADAKESIVLESPYFIPSRAMRRLLEQKLAEGVRVTIVTNSISTTDGLVTYVAYLKYRRHLIRAGANIREFKGPGCLHAKSAVIDGRIALVGSYNIDPRSENLNTEVMSVANDPQAASDLEASIESHVARSWDIGAPNARRARSRSLTFRMWTFRLLLPFVEGQL